MWRWQSWSTGTYRGWPQPLSGSTYGVEIEHRRIENQHWLARMGLGRWERRHGKKASASGMSTDVDLANSKACNFKCKSKWKAQTVPEIWITLDLFQPINSQLGPLESHIIGYRLRHPRSCELLYDVAVFCPSNVYQLTCIIAPRSENTYIIRSSVPFESTFLPAKKSSQIIPNKTIFITPNFTRPPSQSTTHHNGYH